MPGRMEFEFGFRAGQEKGRPAAEDPMRILVMGDLGGRANRGVMEIGAALAARPVLKTDIDNFDERFQRIAPRLVLPLGEGSVEIGFAELDSFHPDDLYDRLEIFQALRRIRKSLLDPETFPQAAAELRHREALEEGIAAPEEGGEPARDAPAEDDDSTLERLLGSAPARTTDAPRPAARRGFDLDRLLRNAVAPHIVPDPDPRQDQYVQAVDDALSELMRGILHHPQYQALESTWRGVWSLVTGLETGEELELFLLDVTKEELAADLSAAEGDLTRTGIHKLLVEKHVETAGGRPWSAIVVDAAFGPDPGDVAALAALGAVGSRAGGPILAAASPAVLGLGTLEGAEEPREWPGAGPEGEELWQAFRECPSAPWIGVALPRVLTRLPYGEKTESIDRFDFEELGTGRGHDRYLWGNPAYSLALLLGRSFAMRGWAMEPGDHLDVEDLPAHSFVEDGETKLQATAEIYLSERAADAVLARGLIPLMSYRNRNAARVARFQSVASPPKGLEGPWA
jgi:type VI secretion system protein ImpC